MDSIPQKRCTKCGNEYPRTKEFFSSSKCAKDSMASQCRQCDRDRRKQDYKKNKQRDNENSKRWRRDHAEQTRQYNKSWYNKHRIARLEYSRKWRTKHHDQAKVQWQNRRARKRGAEGSYTADDVARQFAAQKGHCYYCGKKAKLTVDHIVPLVRGGSNWPSNIVGACGRCNSSKHDKMLHEWSGGKGKLL